MSGPRWSGSTGKKNTESNAAFTSYRWDVFASFAACLGFLLSCAKGRKWPMWRLQVCRCSHRNLSRTAFSADQFSERPGVKRKDFLCNSGRIWELSRQLLGSEHPIFNGSTNPLHQASFDVAPTVTFPFENTL